MRSRRIGLHRRKSRSRRAGVVRFRRSSVYRPLKRGSRRPMASHRYRRGRRFSSSVAARLFPRSFGRVRSFSRRSRGFKTGLTSRPYGPINTVYKYRSRGRRAYHISKRFRKKVNEHVGEILRWNSSTNAFSTGTVGSASWFMLSIGTASDVTSILDFCARHAKGFKVPDPNVTSHAAEQWGFRCRVLNESLVLHGFNESSNSRLECSVYYVSPRQDAWGGVSSYSPLSLITTDAAVGTLYDTASPTATAYTDVDATPFQFPALMNMYRVSRARKFVVHAGGRFECSLRHSYMATVGRDSTFGVPGSTLYARKSQARFLLIKVVGELGILEEAAGVRSIRNAAPVFGARVNFRMSAVVSADKRPIMIVDTAATRTAAGTMNTFEEETLVVPPQAYLDANSSS